MNSLDLMNHLTEYWLQEKKCIVAEYFDSELFHQVPRIAEEPACRPRGRDVRSGRITYPICPIVCYTKAQRRIPFEPAEIRAPTLKFFLPILLLPDIARCQQMLKLFQKPWPAFLEIIRGPWKDTASPVSVHQTYETSLR